MSISQQLLLAYGSSDAESSAGSTVVLLLNPHGANGSTTIPDDSALAHGNGTINGSTIVSTAVTYGGNPTLRFNGGAALGWSDHADFELGANHWCIEATVNFFSLTGNQFIVAKWGGIGDATYSMSKSSTGNKFTFTYTTDGSTNVALDTAWSPSTGVWYNLAVNYDGNKIRMFIDGVLVASSTPGAITLFNGTTRLSVGCETALNSFLLNASVARVRVTKGYSRGYRDVGYTPEAAGYFATT